MLGVALGAVVFRVKGVRGELFALLTLAVTFVLATIVGNTPIDGGQGVSLSAVPVPKIGPTPSSTFYLLALAAATATLLIAWGIAVSRFGAGLFAIHDDEDAAEVMGVPTYRYKLVALAISCALAGVAGGIHALFVSYVTVGEVFTITVPLTVVLMSVLGGTRHWAGPAVGAVAITGLLYSFTAADHAIAGKAVIGAILIAAILFMPDGILPRLQRAFAARGVVGVATCGERRRRRPSPLRQPRERTATVAARRSAPARCCCACSGLRQALQGRPGARRRRRRGAARRDPRPARPERLGQVDLHQRRQRPLRGDGGRDRASKGADARRRAGAPHRRRRHRPHLPDPAPVRAPERARQRRAGGDVRRRRRRSRAQRAREAMAVARVHRPRRPRPTRCPTTLNLHQRKFLELARALASRPRLVLLDEVLCGLTPSEIDDAVALIRRIRDQGATIVFVEHVMRAVMALTDRVVVFDHGELLAEGAPREVMQRPDVMTAYLGQVPHA